MAQGIFGRSLYCPLFDISLATWKAWSGVVDPDFSLFRGLLHIPVSLFPFLILIYMDTKWHTLYNWTMRSLPSFTPCGTEVCSAFVYLSVHSSVSESGMNFHSALHPTWVSCHWLLATTQAPGVTLCFAGGSDVRCYPGVVQRLVLSWFFFFHLAMLT